VGHAGLQGWPFRSRRSTLFGAGGACVSLPRRREVHIRTHALSRAEAVEASKAAERLASRERRQRAEQRVEAPPSATLEDVVPGQHLASSIEPHQRLKVKEELERERGDELFHFLRLSAGRERNSALKNNTRACP